MSSPAQHDVDSVRQSVADDLRKFLKGARVGDSRSEIASNIKQAIKQFYGAPEVSVDGSRMEEGIITANVTLPVSDDFEFITVSVNARAGRFPSRSQNPCREIPLNHPPLPCCGSLVRALTGTKQFGIVGERKGKVGIFWSSDGWVDDYGPGELESMFGDCLKVF